MDDLAKKTIAGFVQFIGALAILLFVGAWTLDFWQAWVYLAVFAAATLLITLHLWKTDPQLLKRRINIGPRAEKEKSQKRIQSAATAAFIGTYLLPALDHRFSWSRVAVPLIVAGDVLVALGFFIIFIVFRENTYSAATVEVAAGQKVISTGPYAMVRHPMYSGALLIFFATPLALGSLWGLVIFIPMTLVIVWRLVDEEKFLLRNLPGYAEYRNKVRRRLLPLVW